MLTFADQVAALELDHADALVLTAARLPAGTPAEVIPFAVTAAEEILRPEPTRQAGAQAVANDAVPRAAPWWPPKPAAAPSIERVPGALRHLLRRPVDLTTRDDHDPTGLPMFLRRDTVFARAAHG
jgi:hypothetical protein